MARRRGTLVGFVNVLWDGFTHVWLQDTMVSADVTPRMGSERSSCKWQGREQGGSGCEWLHVDFEDDLRVVLFRLVRVHTHDAPA